MMLRSASPTPLPPETPTGALIHILLEVTMFFDLPIEQLRAYKPDRVEPP